MIFEVTTEEVWAADDTDELGVSSVMCVVFRPVWWHDRGVTWNGTTDWMAVWGPPWTVRA